MKVSSIAWAALLTACSTTSAHERLMQEVQVRHDSMTALAERGDADALAAAYSRDALLLPPIREPRSGGESTPDAVWGREAIRALMDGMSAGQISESELETLVLDGDGEIAYQAGRYAYTMKAEDGSDKRVRGRFVMVWRKIEGTWKIVLDSYDVAP